MNRSDQAFASAQAAYDAAEPPEPEFEPETVVLRAVVYLTYEPHGALSEDDTIEGVQSPYEAKEDIARVLNPRDIAGGRLRGLQYVPDEVAVYDAEYMSVEEAENHE